MIFDLQSSLEIALTNFDGSSAQFTEPLLTVSKNTSGGNGSFSAAAFARTSACLFCVLGKLHTLKPKKYFSMLRTAARYFASSGLSALYVLPMWFVMSLESDLMDSLLAPSGLALRRPRSKPSYSATLFVHPRKSSLAAYLS